MTQPTIDLLDQKNGSDRPNISLDDLHQHQPTIACDCYVVGIEKAPETKSVDWGWQHGANENVDHHAPVDRMAREVSSANLALLRVAALGPAAPDTRVLITHNDCDSILSSGIISGRLAPDPRYGEAAIAADHTGAPNDTADLLQAIQDRRDLDTAFEQLALLESGQPLHAWAREMRDDRLRKREAAAKFVAGGGFERLGGIAFAAFDGETDGEFFPSLIPDAELIVLAMPHPDAAAREGLLAMKLRRGRAMPEGRDLQNLKILEYDPNFGGRWNAGSNKRGGGTMEKLESWVAGLAEYFEVKQSQKR